MYFHYQVRKWYEKLVTYLKSSYLIRKQLLNFEEPHFSCNIFILLPKVRRHSYIMAIQKAEFTYFFSAEIIISPKHQQYLSSMHFFIDSFGKCHDLSESHKSKFAGFNLILQCHQETRDNIESIFCVRLHKSNKSRQRNEQNLKKKNYLSQEQISLGVRICNF